VKEEPAPAAAPEDAAPAQTPAPSAALRRSLSAAAEHERNYRYGASAVGLTVAGGLFGSGFAAEGDDMTLSHFFWVSSGLAALGSLATVFVPSELEKLERSAGGKSDAELEAAWAKVAADARVERRVGAVFGGLVGATGVVVGALLLDDEDSGLSEDLQLALGASLIAGGAVGVTSSAVSWFLPSRIERDLEAYRAATGGSLTVGVSPTRGGAVAGLSGVF
jgi:hypothetical protein